MPDKIVIPPERPCWKCRPVGPEDMPEFLAFMADKNCTACHGTGRTRIFDEFAAAIKKLLYINYEHTGPSSGNLPGKSYRVKISNGAREYIAFGPTPTAAMEAAAVKFNEGG